MFNIADCVLRWPQSVFVSEVRAVEHMGHTDVELIFEEAFTDRAPLDALIAAQGPSAWLLVEEVLERIDEATPPGRLVNTSANAGAGPPRRS